MSASPRRLFSSRTWRDLVIFRAVETGQERVHTNSLGCLKMSGFVFYILPSFVVLYCPIVSTLWKLHLPAAIST